MTPWLSQTGCPALPRQISATIRHMPSIGPGSDLQISPVSHAVPAVQNPPLHVSRCPAARIAQRTAPSVVHGSLAGIISPGISPGISAGISPGMPPELPLEFPLEPAELMPPAPPVPELPESPPAPEFEPLPPLLESVPESAPPSAAADPSSSPPPSPPSNSNSAARRPETGVHAAAIRQTKQQSLRLGVSIVSRSSNTMHATAAAVRDGVCTTSESRETDIFRGFRKMYERSLASVDCPRARR